MTFYAVCDANAAKSQHQAAAAIRNLGKTVALTVSGAATLELVARDYEQVGD